MILPTAAMLVVLAIGTYWQGIYSERWTPYDSALLEAFTARLNEVPLEFGDWKGEEKEYDKEQFKRSKCRGCVSRLYTNKRNGDKISVYLVSATARHATIHTPDWCYRGAGYDMQGDPYNYDVDCGEEVPTAEFATTTFKKQSRDRQPEHLRILWTFAYDRSWMGPTFAKFHFAGKPALYKLYLITPIGDQLQDIEDSPSLRFARDFMPAINRVLFPAEEAADLADENVAAS